MHLIIFLFSILHFTLLPLVHGSEASETSPSSLLAVQIIFRHGDRKPRSSYVTSYEAQLTNKGKKELLNLGQYIRNRYKSFLGPSTSASKSVDLISSEVDRALDSAQLFTFGLFEDLQKKHVWNEGGLIQYDPIPIRSIPTAIDRYLQSSELCPRYSPDLFLESSYACFEHLNREIPDLFETFVDLSPNLLLSQEFPILNLVTLDALLVLSEEVQYNVSQNLPLSEVGARMSQFPILPSVNHECQLFFFNNTEKLRLHSGPLLQTLLENFQHKLPKKLTVFSAHDRTLYGQLMILGQVPKQIPATGSALIYELHGSSTGNNKKIKIFFKDGMGRDIQEIIGACGQYFCDLNIFAESFKKYIPIDFQQECQKNIEVE